MVAHARARCPVDNGGTAACMHDDHRMSTRSTHSVVDVHARVCVGGRAGTWGVWLGPQTRAWQLPQVKIAGACTMAIE
jgi:hypothetical protein